MPDGYEHTALARNRDEIDERSSRLSFCSWGWDLPFEGQCTEPFGFKLPEDPNGRGVTLAWRPLQLPSSPAGIFSDYEAGTCLVKEEGVRIGQSTMAP